MHRLDVLPGNPEFQHFLGSQLPLLDKALSGDHDEKFPLGVVPVLALGDAGLRDIHAELAAAFGFQQLREAAPGIHIHFQGESHLFLGQVGKIGGVQLLCKAPIGKAPEPQAGSRILMFDRLSINLFFVSALN